MVINDNGVKLFSVSGMSNTTAPFHSAVILVHYSKSELAELSGIRRNIKEFWHENAQWQNFCLEMSYEGTETNPIYYNEINLHDEILLT
jgi:hypothetical protein